MRKDAATGRDGRGLLGLTHPSIDLGAVRTADRLWTPGFAVTWLATFVFWNAVFFHLPLLPLFMKAHGAGEGAIGLVVGGGALAALTGRLLSGWAVDHLGTRGFLLAGALAWALTSPLMAGWPGTGGLLALRLVQGFGLALFTNASLGVVGYIAPPSRRGAAVGWWGITNNLANATGPWVAGAVLGGYGYGAAFAAAGAMGALAALLGLMMPRAGGTAARGAAALGSARLYTPAALVPGLVGGTLGFAGGAFVAFAPLRAEELGLSNVGSYLAAYGMAMIASRLVFSPLSDVSGRGWAIVPGLVMATAAMAAIGWSGEGLLAYAPPALFGLGAGAVLPGLLAWTLDRSGPGERATATSTFYSVYELGLFSGATVLGQLLQRGGPTAYWVVAALLAGGLGLYLTAAGSRRAAARSDHAGCRRSTGTSP